MDIYERICTAVTPVVPVCVPVTYTGAAQEYCTFNVTDIPDAEGDNAPTQMRHLVQLHYYLPLDQNPILTKRALRQAVLAAGFTYPEETNSSDDDGYHYVLEFEDVDGDV